MDMNYCKECGAKVVQDASTKFTCSTCANVYYVNPKAATSIIPYTQDGKVLIGVRAVEPHKGKLDCIGGFVDVGENLEEAVLRELQEEIGLSPKDIGALEYVGTAYDSYPWQDREVPVTSVYYRTVLRPGARPEAADDVASIVIVDLSSIKKEEVAWEGMWKVLQAEKERARSLHE